VPADIAKPVVQDIIESGQAVCEGNAQRAPLDCGTELLPQEIDDLCADRAIAAPVPESGDALLFDETTANQTALRKWSVAEQGVAVGWFSRAPGFAPQRGTPLAV
jgi:hypothetical protein